MIIPLKDCSTIYDLFKQRLALSSSKDAYRQFDTDTQTWVDYAWKDILKKVFQFQCAFHQDGLSRGDKVAVMVRNSVEWVAFDIAAHGMGLVTVPLYVDDSPANVAYVIKDSGVKFLLVQNKEQWDELSQEDANCLKMLTRVVSVSCDDMELPVDTAGGICISLSSWITAGNIPAHIYFVQKFMKNSRECISPNDLASIVYTSGTTGNPKGVMLSHKNILTNTFMVCKHKLPLKDSMFTEEDTFLSFLPLSHMFERIVGYMVPMMVGGHVTYARSVALLGEDLISVKPSVFISVPRIYEKVYGGIMGGLQKKSAISRMLFRMAISIGWKKFEYEQGRKSWAYSLLLWPLLNKLVAQKVMACFGGNVRISITGGAALSPEIAKTFIGLGLPLLQGYGLTESSVVISCNLAGSNVPNSVGLLLPRVEARIGDNDELQTKSDCVMLGYYNNPQASNEAMTKDGWLRTGDKACMDEHGHIHITGRIKEIIVMSSGEKVPPVDMEMAIALDTTFTQVMVIGEGRPFLTAVVVIEPDTLSSLETQFNGSLESEIQKRLANKIKSFPGYARIRKIAIIKNPWTVENGLLTPTMKKKRRKITELHSEAIEGMYRKTA